MGRHHPGEGVQDAVAVRLQQLLGGVAGHRHRASPKHNLRPTHWLRLRFRGLCWGCHNLVLRDSLGLVLWS